jgi:putative Mg2+ transporter-C (MgtC) family protein
MAHSLSDASYTTLRFVLNLAGATGLGAVVGLEREWRQRMAGTRTNALVAAGASAFVMAGWLLGGDPSAPGRAASYVISGVGFLGAGVIFKDGASVRGLNTAATIWCSAAIGVLAGLDSLHLASILALIVLVTNIALRPLSCKLRPVLPAAEPAEAMYEIMLTSRSADETHVRTLLLATIAQERATILQAIHSDDEEGSDRTRLRAEISTHGRQNDLVEKIAVRLSIEPGVTSLSWSVVPTAME